MRSSAPNPPNPRSARPGGRAHRLGGRGRRLGGRDHAHRRGRRRSRRIGLPRASRQARFMAVKKEPLRSGGRIGRRCMPGGWGGAGEAGGGLGGAQFSSCPGNGTSNPGTDHLLDQLVRENGLTPYALATSTTPSAKTVRRHVNGSTRAYSIGRFPNTKYNLLPKVPAAAAVTQR